MIYPLLRSVLFQFSPETAHYLTLRSLQFSHRTHLAPLFFGRPIEAPCQVMGLNFPNPVGLAAGLDKNAEYIDALGRLGFGFIEVGTVTPYPQPGNPQPRLFRLPSAQSIINRMGFNNQGIDQLIEQVKNSHFHGVLGINLGKNFDTPVERAVEDYLIGLHKVYAYADYVTVNISSPNTPGLRQLQQQAALETILSALKQAQKQLAVEQAKYVPLVIKIAPDLTHQEIAMIADSLLTHHIDGVIATNTTLSRTGVEHLPLANEAGGLSGAPLMAQATEVVQQLNLHLKGKIPIIAAGGIMSASEAQQKRHAGASLVQIYTGLIYRGPALIKEIIHAFKSP